MRKEIVIVQIKCDWCKTECESAGRINFDSMLRTYDICEHCENELKAILEFDPEQPLVITKQHEDKVATGMDAIEKIASIPYTTTIEEKPKRGRKKKDEIVEPPNAVEYAVASLGLDMRKRQDADIIEKAINKLPENPSNQEMIEAIESIPVYFAECDEHKAMLKEHLCEMGFDFTNEEHRLDAMNIRLGLLNHPIELSELSQWLLSNVDRKEAKTPF